MAGAAHEIVFGDQNRSVPAPTARARTLCVP